MFKIGKSDRGRNAVFTFLACAALFGCLWYMSSQARQNSCPEQAWHRTRALEVPHRSHISTSAPPPGVGAPISS